MMVYSIDKKYKISDRPATDPRGGRAARLLGETTISYALVPYTA
jgi:hypothetical protein